MNKDKVIITIGALILIAFIGKTYFFTSKAEDAVKSTLESIADLMSTDEPITPVQLAFRVESLKNLISQEIEAILTTKHFEKSVSGFKPIQAGALAASRMIKSSKVSLLSIEVEIEQSIAQAQFHSLVLGEDIRGESFRQRYSVDARLEKNNDGSWVITQIEVAD